MVPVLLSRKMVSGCIIVEEVEDDLIETTVSEPTAELTPKPTAELTSEPVPEAAPDSSGAERGFAEVNASLQGRVWRKSCIKFCN